jgi:hypothetical protein
LQSSAGFINIAVQYNFPGGKEDGTGMDAGGGQNGKKEGRNILSEFKEGRISRKIMISRKKEEP